VALAGLEQVLEAPELEGGAEPQRLAIAPQAHRAVEAAGVDREAAIELEADEEERAGLVGGEGQRCALAGEPGGELTRGEDLEAFVAGGWGGHKRWRDRGWEQEPSVARPPDVAAQRVVPVLRLPAGVLAADDQIGQKDVVRRGG
jgi:hypothetical protein